MNYEWIDGYLMEKSGVTKNSDNWNWDRYMVGGKMFLAVCRRDEDNQPYYITLKLESSEGAFLREQYEDIIPGYYMNKLHWNSIKVGGSVPNELVRELSGKAYNLVLKGLPKKLQKEILDGSAV